MDKVKQLADELYNQKILDGWKNVSMETCLKRATDYYRMDKVVKKLNYIPCCMGEDEQLPQDNYCQVCKLPTDGEKCYSKRCPV
jgi:hypothetical protein